MNQKYLLSKGDVFAQAGLSMVQIKYWNEIQAQMNKKGFVFIEYPQDNKKEYIWRCLFESGKSQKKEFDLKSSSFDNDTFNLSLTKQFVDRESYSNTYWDNFMDDIKWSGYYIPVDEFKYFTNPELIDELRHSYLFKKYFKAKAYLTSVKKDSIELAYKRDPIVMFGIWHFIVFYADFLSTCFTSKQIKDEPKTNWHTRNITIRKFHNYLPARQLTNLLMMVVEAQHLVHPNVKRIESLLKYSHSSVVNFFERFHEETLTAVVEKSEILLTSEMKDDFLEICRFDKKIIATLEILSDDNFLKYQPFLKFYFKNEALGDSPKNIFSKIKKAVSEISILDLLWFDPGNTSLKPRRYVPKFDIIRFPAKLKWYDLNDDVVHEIDTYLRLLPPKLFENLDHLVNFKWSSQLMNIANQLTPPALIWKLIHDQTIPNWNLFDNKTAKKHFKAFYEKQESLAAQKRRYKKAISSLEKLKTKDEIESFAKEVSPFFDAFIKNQWNYKINQHLENVERTKAFRERKMIELGIKKEGDAVDFRTDIWLDEMLQIEEEIRKYIPFVKKAFTAALPIRKTIEFNSERHVQSGIEFDPQHH